MTLAERRFPVLATIFVLAAVATMIALGFWQVGRAHQRDSERASLTERLEMPAIVFPYSDPTNSALVYRAVTAECLAVVGWETVAGKGTDGQTGWAHVAQCEGPRGARLKVNVGISPRPDAEVEWQGGRVSGVAIPEPDTRGIWSKILRTPDDRPLMVVARAPAADLVAAKPPSPLDEDNTSWAYAMQWFFFAATALVIYGFALRKRWRG